MDNLLDNLSGNSLDNLLDILLGNLLENLSDSGMEPDWALPWPERQRGAAANCTSARAPILFAAL